MEWLFYIFSSLVGSIVGLILANEIIKTIKLRNHLKTIVEQMEKSRLNSVIKSHERVLRLIDLDDKMNTNI